ncbi:MAG: glycosyltransferase, partial [Chitinophagaceae bacterium]|nr:glycosyltransferase [Chitinophagaceae bacterium]
ANSDQLQQLIDSSTLIICRSGYSSVMDMACTGSKALFIPTPGQTEQEYLADYLSQMKWFNACHQNHFNLNNEVQTFSQTHFKAFPALNFQLFQKVIDEI